MGVDNKSIITIGLPEKECDISKLPDMTQEEYDDRNGDLWSWSGEHPDFLEGLEMTAQSDNGYDRRERFLGFNIVETRSYGHESLSLGDFMDKLSKATRVFWKVFGQEPKMYVIEYQY